MSSGWDFLISNSKIMTKSLLGVTIDWTAIKSKELISISSIVLRKKLENWVENKDFKEFFVVKFKVWGG